MRRSSTSRRQPSAHLIVESLETRLLLCDTPPAPPPPEGATIAAVDEVTAPVTKKVLYIRAAYKRSPEDADKDLELFAPQPLEGPGSAKENMQWVHDFMYANSFRMVSFATTHVLVELPDTDADYDAMDDGLLHDQARTAARNLNPTLYDETKFDFVAVRYADARGGGTANKVGGKYTWLRNSLPGTAAHEFGHNLGLAHANRWIPQAVDSIVGAGTSAEYGNEFDVMGGRSGRRIASHFNVAAKDNLGWLRSADVPLVTPANNNLPFYPVYPADIGTAAVNGRTYALNIAKGDGRTYWVGVRQHPDLTGTIRSGIELVWGRGEKQVTDLLDTNPGNNAFALVVGQTFSDDVSGIHITPVNLNNLGDASLENNSIDVVVKFTDPANQDPILDTFSVPETVAPGAEFQLSAGARDLDGDSLAYHWDFEEAGTINHHSYGANASQVTKSWGLPGDYRVRLTVSDMRGGVVSRSAVVSVRDADLVRPMTRISGRIVDLGGQPVPKVRLSFDKGSVVEKYAYSDSDGTYALVLEADEVAAAVVAEKPGWTFAVPGFTSPTERVVLPGPQTVGVDFRGTPLGYRISGRVMFSNQPLPGVLVTTSSGHSDFTDSTGSYSLWAGNGQHVLTFSKSGHSFAANPSANVEHQNVQIHDVSPVPATTFSGTISGLPFGAGQTPITVTVSADGLQDFAAVDQGNGVYSYEGGGIVPGVYNLTATAYDGVRRFSFSPSGWTNPTGLNALVRRAFSADAVTRYYIRGRVTDAGTRQVDVLVEARDAAGNLRGTSRTDRNGGYAITGLEDSAPGGYTVTVLSPNQTPRTVTVAGDNVTGIDFTGIALAPNTPPTIVAAASAGAAGGAQTGTWVGFLCADDRGAERLRYEWEVMSPPSTSLVFPRDDNRHNSAKHTLVAFPKPGTYVLRAHAIDEDGLRVHSDVSLTISEVQSNVRITPISITVRLGATQQFQAEAMNQFGQVLPDSVNLSVAGGGTIDPATGMFTAPMTAQRVNIIAQTVHGGQTSATADVRTATVTGRQVFYNNSSYDLNRAAIDSYDDLAVAPDKTALLPGTGPATFANYTSYSRGINGVMVDLNRTFAPVTAADFIFRFGNDNSPAGWAAAPAPANVQMRRVDGVDRVTIVWPDYNALAPSPTQAVHNAWLQVTVLANDRTGLAAPDVFYFGNLPGESYVEKTATGESIFRVNTYDSSRTGANLAQGVAVTSLYDHNRDGNVDQLDVDICWENRNNGITVLVVPV